jgi:hypothetical protein
VFLLIGLPALLGWVLWRLHTKKPVANVAVTVTIVATTIAWTVARNLPGFPLVPTLYGG